MCTSVSPLSFLGAVEAEPKAFLCAASGRTEEVSCSETALAALAFSEWVLA